MHKNHSKGVIYYTNSGLLAGSSNNNGKLAEYVDRLLIAGLQSDLDRGYYHYLNAMLESSRGNRLKSLEQYKLSTHAFTEAASSRGEAAAALGVSYSVEDDGESMRWAERSCACFARCEDEIGMSKALLNIGVACTRLNAYPRSIETLTAALQIEKHTANYREAGTSLLNLASAYFGCGDLAAAILCATESIEWLNKGIGTDNAYIWQTNGWAKIEQQCEHLLANAYINCGSILSALGGRESALNVYEHAHQIMQKVNNHQGRAVVLNQIGDVYREQEDYVAAESYSHQSKDLFEQTGTRGYMYAVALQSVGEACAAQRRFKEAVEYYQDSLKEFKAAASREGEAEILLLSGEAFYAEQRYEEARGSIEQANSIAQSIAAKELVVRCNRALGSVLMHVESTKSREYLNRALLLAEEHSMKLEQQRIHRELASYYKLVGDSTEALSHFEKFHALEREIFTENADRRLKNFEILHRVEQYKQSLEEMTTKVRQIESELEEKTRELATLAERIMEKQEFVRMVESGLNKLIAAQPTRKDSLAQELLEKIRSAGDVSSDWDDLTKKFLIIHREFAERLMKIAPDITPAELQVCVLIRLSMGAKQIADVLNIVPKTVFNHQQKIREKLRLVNRENLKGYLMMLDVSDDGLSMGTPQ